MREEHSSGAALLPKTQRNFVADLAAKHGQRLRRFLAARLRNRADTADLAQEVFLRLLRVERFEQIRSPEAYLLTVASHVIHQHSLKHVNSPSTSDAFEALLDEHLATDSDPAAQVHLERRLEALDLALARLPTRTRSVFVLQRRDGCTVDEISARLKISRGAVKKHLARAIAQCSRQLQEPGQERQ
jgi:RNA polymerase sigma-70 factor (ECF subfamily)